MPPTELRERFEYSRFYFPVRTAVDRACRPSRAQRRRRRLAFLSNMLESGMLVFDVGANVGEYAELYRALGCRVVAAEPFPACAHIVRRRLPDVTVVEAAVGAEVGLASMHVGTDDPLNTLSGEYAALLREGGQAKLETIGVAVTTLDALAAEYGTPDYVKIDVEGYERQVLAGMTFQPSLVSFEIHGSLLDEAAACMDALPERSFSLTLAEDFAWTARAQDRDQMLELIAELTRCDPDLYGDVYAQPAG